MKLRIIAAALVGALFAGAAAPVATMRLDPDPADAVEALRSSGLVQSPAGSVELDCQTKADGALDRCRVVKETPSGSGLGRAGLVLAPNYRASALGPVHVTVSFKSFEAMRWTRKPSGSDLERAVLDARLKDADGVAVLTCRSDPSGELTACQVTSSQPDSRYGEAAMRLTSHFGLKPAIYDGQPVSAPVRVPITFNMP